MLERMREFAATKPSPQQTRQKTAREMVGLFASELAAALSASRTAQEGQQDLWQAIYDAAANEGTILHDDTVSAIERGIRAAFPSSPAEGEKEEK